MDLIDETPTAMNKTLTALLAGATIACGGANPPPEVGLIAKRRLLPET